MHPPGTWFLGIPLIGAVFTLAMGVHASRPWGGESVPIGEYVGLLGFMAWAVSPYLGMALLIRRCLSKPVPRRLAGGGSAILTVLAGMALWSGFVTDPDAQSGLLFFALPVLQWPALALVWLVCHIVGRRTG